MRDRMRPAVCHAGQGHVGPCVDGVGDLRGPRAACAMPVGGCSSARIAALMLAWAVFVVQDPDTLKRRLSRPYQNPKRAQKGCVALIGLLLCASFALCGARP